MSKMYLNTKQQSIMIRILLCFVLLLALPAFAQDEDQDPGREIIDQILEATRGCYLASWLQQQAVRITMIDGFILAANPNTLKKTVNMVLETDMLCSIMTEDEGKVKKAMETIVEDQREKICSNDFSRTNFEFKFSEHELNKLCEG